MYQFDVKDATLKCVEWIKEFFEKNGPTCNAVLGISGGKDSTVVAMPFDGTDTLEAVVNEAIAELRADGTIDAWFNEYEEYAKSLGL